MVWEATALREETPRFTRRWIAEWWPGAGRVTLHSENPKYPNRAVTRRWIRAGAGLALPRRPGWTTSEHGEAARYPSAEAFEAAAGPLGLVRQFELDTQTKGPRQ
jgi:hypothetical protein